MTDQPKLDDNDTEATATQKDQAAQPERQDVPLVGKTEEIDAEEAEIEEAA